MTWSRTCLALFFSLALATSAHAVIIYDISLSGTTPDGFAIEGGGIVIFNDRALDNDGVFNMGAGVVDYLVAVTAGFLAPNVFSFSNQVLAGADYEVRNGAVVGFDWNSVFSISTFQAFDPNSASATPISSPIDWFDGQSRSLCLQVCSVTQNWSLRTTPVPEPGSLVLFGVGLLGLGLFKRRPSPS